MVIPKNEILWLQYLDSENNATHVVTSDKHRDTYKLYKIEDGDLIYAKRKSNDPRNLERYVWTERGDS